MDAENLLAKVTDNLSVRRAFGTAYEKDGMLIIPVAIVAGGGGGGTSRTRRGNVAAGPDSPPEEGAAAQDATPRDSGRADAGGGSGGLVLPSGIYVVRGDQVRWVPAVDVTIAVLASLSLVRMLARTWTRQRRHRGS
ncbi:MAG TPA: spore germination protein GerW family protein [Streptosporangiaceae bacterium]|nr:spore germination protein GerW family protein [Streptosporangiaceae bacterium]